MISLLLLKKVDERSRDIKEQKAETQAKISELTQIEQKLEYRLKALEDAVHTQCCEQHPVQ